MTFIPRSQTKAARTGSKGKSSEEVVQAFLKGLAERRRFDFERNHDARSSGGHNLTRRCGDFTWYCEAAESGRTYHGVIEVKELAKLATFPYSRLDQLGKLKRRTLAGGLAHVLICVASGTAEECWVCQPVSWFDDRKVDSRASWDLRELTCYSSAEATPILRSLDEWSFNPS